MRVLQCCPCINILPVYAYIDLSIVSSRWLIQRSSQQPTPANSWLYFAAFDSLHFFLSILFFHAQIEYIWTLKGSSTFTHCPHNPTLACNISSESQQLSKMVSTVAVLKVLEVFFSSNSPLSLNSPKRWFLGSVFYQ